MSGKVLGTHTVVVDLKLIVIIFLISEAASIISDICKAIAFLHSTNIAHRDLKVSTL